MVWRMYGIWETTSTLLIGRFISITTGENGVFIGRLIPGSDRFVLNFYATSLGIVTVYYRAMPNYARKNDYYNMPPRTLKSGKLFYFFF